MKKLFTLFAGLSVLHFAGAQTWSTVDFPSNMVWQAAELNNKLYIADGGSGLQELNGTTWTALTDFNNSLNAPHKSKSSVVNIGGILYAGARDFNTSGEGTMHTFNGSTFSLLQNSDFQYNGSYKVFDFAEYGGAIYAGGQFMSPDNNSANLAKWDGTDWVGVGTNTLNYLGNQNNIVNRLIVFQNKLYVLADSKALIYNGTAWDSLQGGEYSSSFRDGAVFNSELYVCGSLMFYDNGNLVGSSNIGKWDGTTFSPVQHPYYDIRRLYADGGYLYAIVQLAYQGDVYLARYDGTNWLNYAFLQDGAGGVVPGYPLSDYNRIFKFNNELYIGGRFAEINNTAIQSLAKLSVPPTNFAPLPPTNLVVTFQKTASNYVQLDWQDNSNNEDGFVVMRSDDFGLNYNNVGSVGPDVETFNDNNILSQTTYYYKVYAYNGIGNSGFSNIANISTGTVGIEENSNAIAVYPNPTEGILKVETAIQKGNITISDITGNKVISENLSDGKLTLDITALSAGIYQITLTDDSGTAISIQKLMKK